MKEYALEDVRITTAGVFRCCLATIGSEYLDEVNGNKLVTVGMKSTCTCCKEVFALTEGEPHPILKPDWQLQPKAGLGTS